MATDRRPAASAAQPGRTDRAGHAGADDCARDLAVSLAYVLLARHASDVWSVGGEEALPVRHSIAPAAPPPAAALNPPVTPPTPKGSPADWFSEDYYPPAAKAASIEGRVRVVLEVDATGIPRGCTVVESSGNEDLDATTCKLAVRFGRFRPAMDANGNPVPGRARMPPVRWQLRDE